MLVVCFSLYMYTDCRSGYQSINQSISQSVSKFSKWLKYCNHCKDHQLDDVSR